MDSSRWQNGIAAWDDLAFCGEDHLIDINDWLIRLGTRCIVLQQKLVDMRELPVYSKLKPPSPELAEWLLRQHTSAVRRVGLLRANNEQEAIEYFSKSLKVFEELDIQDYMATAYNLMGDCYLHQGDNKKALEYFSMSLKINTALEIQDEIAGGLGNLGYAKFKLGK